MASHVSQDLHNLPTRRLLGSVTEVPDFTRIPPHQWEPVMRTIPQRLRHPAIRALALPPDQLATLSALALSDLPPTPSDRAREAVLGDPKIERQPSRRRGRLADRQVNLRLTDEEYLDLATAAELVDASPTRLAAMLVRNGVQRVIAEANRQDG